MGSVGVRRIRRWVVLVACLAAGAAATAALHPAGLGAAPAAAKAGVGTSRSAAETLIQWRKVAFWSHALHAIPVHRLPTVASPTVARLHKETEDGFPEVYLVLARSRTPDGRAWLKIALPMRPNGTTGWVVKGALGQLRRVTTWLIIDRSRLRARFYDHGRQKWNAPVGIGKPSTPTPRGLYWVREEFQLTNQPFYGPYAFGTSAYANVSDWPGGGVVGLHGTNLPQLVPGRPSHGCVRLHNKDILWLAYHMPVGTPIAIIN